MSSGRVLIPSQLGNWDSAERSETRITDTASTGPKFPDFRIHVIDSTLNRSLRTQLCGSLYNFDYNILTLLASDARMLITLHSGVKILWMFRKPSHSIVESLQHRSSETEWQPIGLRRVTNNTNLSHHHPNLCGPESRTVLWFSFVRDGIENQRLSLLRM